LGVFEVSVESVWEVVDELFCATKTGGLADLVVITCQRRVAESDVLAYLLCIRYVACGEP
jgi:hypothetical protein